MGPVSERVRTYFEVEGDDRSDLPGQIERQLECVRRRMGGVGHVVAVTSGKGGVGKSFTAAGLAVAAARAGRRVALLDADLNGPTAARLLGLGEARLSVDPDGVSPAAGPADVAVVSMALLLGEGAPLEWRGPAGDDFVWRGARERGAVREFLSDVRWGSRDLLFVDLPPGTHRLVEVAELIPRLGGIVAVTIPAASSRVSVERGLEACRRRELPILGLVENMAGYACPGCGTEAPLFSGSAAAELANRFACPVLGRVPFDPAAARRAERGEMAELVEKTRAGARLREIAGLLVRRLDAREGGDG